MKPSRLFTLAFLFAFVALLFAVPAASAQYADAATQPALTAPVEAPSLTDSLKSVGGISILSVSLIGLLIPAVKKNATFSKLPVIVYIAAVPAVLTVIAYLTGLLKGELTQLIGLTVQSAVGASGLHQLFSGNWTIRTSDVGTVATATDAPKMAPRVIPLLLMCLSLFVVAAPNMGCAAFGTANSATVKDALRKDYLLGVQTYNVTGMVLVDLRKQGLIDDATALKIEPVLQVCDTLISAVGLAIESGDTAAAEQDLKQFREQASKLAEFQLAAQAKKTKKIQ